MSFTRSPRLQSEIGLSLQGGSPLQVCALYRYPVKSCPGLAVSSLALDDFGPAGDRRWLLVDDGGRFVTQRSEPSLAQVAVAEGAVALTLTLPGGPELELRPGLETMRVSVWGDQVWGLKAAGLASTAISEWLGRRLYFVFMPADTVRLADPDFVSGRRVGFADGFPFLITNPASLEALEAWTGSRWDMRRFRPGIVISGAGAFAEDQWRWLRIGEAVLECVKPCSRCVMTTVDPETGQVHPEREPLRTLSRYRKSDAGIIFGQNAVHWHGGSIAVGDAVELLDGSPL